MAARRLFTIQGPVPLELRISIKFTVDENNGNNAINNDWDVGVLGTTNWFNLVGSSSEAGRRCFIVCDCSRREQVVA